MENGYVSAESATETAEAGSLSVNVQFTTYAVASVPVVSSTVRIGTVRVLPNIGLESDSSVDVLDGYITTMENAYHLKNVKRFY